MFGITAYRRLIFSFALLFVPLYNQAQSSNQAAAYQRTVARVQVSLVKRDLDYLSKSSRTSILTKNEQFRLELVVDGDNAAKKLHSLPDFPARVALRTIALRLVQAQTQGFAADYKYVNDLSVYRGNSLKALRIYYAAFDAALQKTVSLNDSLRAARQDFADEFDVLLDNQEMRAIDQWLGAEHRFADLFQYQHQVMLPIVRVQRSSNNLITAIGAADIGAYEKALRELTAEVATAKSELAVVPDFINLDVLYRNAGRELVNAYGALCSTELAHISTLLKEQPQSNSTQIAVINQTLADFTAKINATNLAFENASKDFFKVYRPVLDDANRH